MDRQIAELTALMERQGALYDRLAAVLDDEKTAAVAASPAALEEIRQIKEPLLNDLESAERSRQELVGRMALAAGLAEDGVPLKTLARHLDARAADRLLRSRKALARRLEAVGHRNREVGDLLGCGLRLVRGTMALMTQATQPERVYQRSGRFASGAGGGRIVSGNI